MVGVILSLEKGWWWGKLGWCLCGWVDRTTEHEEHLFRNECVVSGGSVVVHLWICFVLLNICSLWW